MRAPVGLAASLLTIASQPSAAALVAEYPDAVPAFATACVKGELTLAAREAALAADGWVPDSSPDVNVPGFNKSGALDHNFDFTKPETVRQWSKTVDGVRARAVLATFPADRRYPALCAVLFPEVRNVLAYDDAFRDLAKSIGLKGKSFDAPHYVEYSGKIDGKPVRAEALSRSAAAPQQKSMHLYVAFQ